MANKITKKDRFNELREWAEERNRADMVEFIDHEIELLSKKSSSTALTARQKENLGVKDTIISVLSSTGTAQTVTEIVALLNYEYTSQRVTALLSQLKEEQRVYKYTDKKKAYWSVIA